MSTSDDALTRLVEAVCASPRHRSVVPELVARIGARELAHRCDWKAAVKATKAKLHQVVGAFLDPGMDYDHWLHRLGAANGGQPQFRQACVDLMQQHSSTRERLSILEEFYAAVLNDLPPPTSVLDLACGLQPLAIPWMKLAPGALYVACDALTDLTAFLDAYLALTGVHGRAVACDVTRDIPSQPVDVAFVLKSLPSLEQVDKGCGRRLLRTIRAKWLVVSFPAHSLGGRSKGMPQHYETYLRSLIADEPWEVQRFGFASEVAFRLRKSSSRTEP